jgi:hypothetical protein
MLDNCLNQHDFDNRIVDVELDDHFAGHGSDDNNDEDGHGLLLTPTSSKTSKTSYI